MTDVVADQAPLLLRVIISTLAIGGIFILARIITRTVIRPQFGWDDALIVITWFLILGFNTSIFVAIHHGYGKHIRDLTEPQAVAAMKAEIIGGVLANISYPTGKASVAYLLMRIFLDRRLKWILWSFVACNAVLFYINSILILVQCQPVSFQWDRSIAGGSCWSPKVVLVWGFTGSVLGAITDFVFAILPWIYVQKLQMRLKEKIGVGVALGMGAFAGACSIVKTYYIDVLRTEADFTVDTVPLVLWSCTELALINVAACIPTLRPLYLWMTGAKLQTSSALPSSSRPSGRSTYFSGAEQNTHRSARSTQSRTVDDHNRNIRLSRVYELDSEDLQTESPNTATTNRADKHSLRETSWYHEIQSIDDT